MNYLLIYSRHYKLEAEIASMTWKVHWEDVIVVAPGKPRGSMYSLTGKQHRGSQLVNTSLDINLKQKKFILN